MPGKKKPGPSVKDDKVYEEIRDQGGSKEKAAESPTRRRRAADPRLARRVARRAPTTTGRSKTCASGPRNSACRATQARRSPNWYRCCAITD